MTQEKPWWRCCENEALDGGACLNCGTDSQEHQKKIVAEAERRTWEEATDRMFQELEAVKGLNSFVPETHHKEYLQGIFQAYRILKSKLSSLTKK